MWCDGKKDCTDGTDEGHCSTRRPQTQLPYPSMVDMSDHDHGSLVFSAINATTVKPRFVSDLTDSRPTTYCPHTHFQCVTSDHCLPVYMRCNGVWDCPTMEDELECDHYQCPGYFRCRSSTVCLHPTHVCDRIFQCPQHDDELLCDLHCPLTCACYGLAFTCTESFPAHTIPQLRYLSASGSEMAVNQLTDNIMLIHLSLSDCGLHLLHSLSLPNLNSLDISKNSIHVIDIKNLSLAHNLGTLILRDNPIISLFLSDNKSAVVLDRLKSLDLSGVNMETLDPAVLDHFPNLLTLNLSHTGIVSIKGPGFQHHPTLRVLDLRGCSVTMFPRGLLQDLGDLQALYCDNYKLCCPAILPTGFHLDKCVAPFDEVSSCEDLLQSLTYRFFLSVASLLAILGNAASLIIRMVTLKSSRSGFGVFVIHLCASDLFMGVYLAIIGVADRWYQNTYLWEDNTWRHSVTCQLAGFLSLLSSEVSAFIVFLITVDRFLVLQFPFSHVHFQKVSAQATCLLIWTVGVLLAGFPLLPATAHWQFYSQKGICIPLPVTRQQFAGQDYVFGVVIILNFLLFVLIAVGQMSILLSVRASRMTSRESSRQTWQEVRIARRLLVIVMSDFLCWFPIGVLGLMASTGAPVPGQVNVAMAIFVLPLNSALNPFLYTVNILMESRQRDKEKRLLLLITQTHTKAPACQEV